MSDHWALLDSSISLMLSSASFTLRSRYTFFCWKWQHSQPTHTCTNTAVYFIVYLYLEFFDFLISCFLFVHQLIVDFLLRLKNEPETHTHTWVMMWHLSRVSLTKKQNSSRPVFVESEYSCPLWFHWCHVRSWLSWRLTCVRLPRTAVCCQAARWSPHELA